LKHVKPNIVPPQDLSDDDSIELNVTAEVLDQNTIGPYDVLCGRGGATNSNEGNVKFRQLIHEQKVRHEI